MRPLQFLDDINRSTASVASFQRETCKKELEVIQEEILPRHKLTLLSQPRRLVNSDRMDLLFQHLVFVASICTYTYNMMSVT